MNLFFLELLFFLFRLNLSRVLGLLGLLEGLGVFFYDFAFLFFISVNLLEFRKSHLHVVSNLILFFLRFVFSKIYGLVPRSEHYVFVSVNAGLVVLLVGDLVQTHLSRNAHGISLARLLEGD